MNKIKYITHILTVIIFFSCTEEELFKNKEEIEVTAGFATTRTTFTEDNGTTHVTWNTEDVIGLFTKEQNNLQYTALNEGNEAKFDATWEKLKAVEGETVYAYYPHSYQTDNLQRIKLPNLISQYYQENASKQDFIYASGNIINNKLSLRFKHVFAFLKITIPLELIADRGEKGGLYIYSSEEISCDNHFDLKKGQIEEPIISDKYNHINYYIPSVRELENKHEITCYLAILPQTENAELKIYSNKNGNKGDCLLTKKALSGGFKAGNIYTLYLNENESETIRVQERESLIAFYKATNGDNWKNSTNWCSDKPISEWYGVYTNDNGRIEHLDLSSNNLSGVLPDEIGNLQELTAFSVEWNNLSGTIPTSIERLDKLQIFRISCNNIEGPIPEGIWRLTELIWFMAGSNKLNGTLPETIGNLKNLKIFTIGSNNIEGAIPEGVADLPLLEMLQLYYNRFSGPIPSRVTQCEHWNSWIPSAHIFPQQPGYTLSMEDYYISTDFSKDGETTTLQTHTKGNGIKIVLMGDLFVDTDMESGGKYETVMREAMENFFSIEPYKSIREYFDVISIKAVSKHDWMSGETAFETTISSGGLNENTNKCLKYAQKALRINSLDDVQIIMVLNLVAIAGGHCSMYANGCSVSCCAYNKDDPNDFKELIYHEAGGHGFVFFRDEYILSEEKFTDIEGLQQNHSKGWSANVDYISDLTKIKWAHFINDSRYIEEDLGAFEGALCRYDIYRATEYSIMRESINDHHLINQFNAPMREAIYKRAMKLAYGDSWTYNYEEFVKFDIPGHAEFVAAKNRAKTRSIQQISISPKYKHVPPRIYNYPAIVK